MHFEKEYLVGTLLGSPFRIKKKKKDDLIYPDKLTSAFQKWLYEFLLKALSFKVLCAHTLLILYLVKQLIMF